MYILGISAFYHDSAACVIHDGEIIAAVQEERFSRKKHDASFPRMSIQYCLRQAGIEPSNLDQVVFYEKPFLKFERLLETYLAFSPRGFRSFLAAMPIWIKEKLFQKIFLAKDLAATLGDSINWYERILFSEHHLSHAASAFYPSPFERAAILTLDGVGEWATTSISIGNGRNLDPLKEIHFPHSIGLLYSAFTYYIGFKVNSGEYKVMGLAPYGDPKYVDLIKQNLVNIADDGSFQLDMSYFDFATGLAMTNKKFERLFGGKPRKPEAVLTQREMDLAASIQKVAEEIVIRIARDISKKTEEKNLCLAGGVALNCVINGILQREKIFANIWVQPAAGDAGGALGAALAVWHLHFENPRLVLEGKDKMQGSYLGPEFTDDEIELALVDLKANYEKLSEEELMERVIEALADEKAIGWMQGRMEFGPRALGARSIIADPRSPKMQKLLNLKVKYRESFRPFAPSILREASADWFDLDTDCPYMQMVAYVNENKRIGLTQKEEAFEGIEKLNAIRSKVPAVTHVDYSARLQTVHEDTNRRFHSLITRFKDKTGCPLVVNTSFNVRGEPIICSPSDAYKCFMGTDLDVLAIGNFLLLKECQTRSTEAKYETEYELD
jgi:carbamoyltransferase